MMLRAYFDDSGTHGNSEVVVMGGLIGSVEQWERFEHAWAAKLADPLPGYGKPPLRMFHLSTCNAGGSEFADYRDAEQDAVIHDFRQIIIDAGLTSTASAIDRKAWDELITGNYRKVMDEPLSACFVNCIESGRKLFRILPIPSSSRDWYLSGRPFSTYHASQIHLAAAARTVHCQTPPQCA